MSWNTIDLHMHTSEGITRSGESDTVNFTYKKFVKTIDKFELKLTAITNHNVINLANYFACKFLANKINVNLLLGIEIDTCFFDEQPLHSLIIFKDNFNINLGIANKLNLLTKEKKKSGEVVYKIKEIFKLVRDADSVLIPHGDKSRGIFKDASRKTILQALEVIKEGFIRIFDSPSNWKLEKIKQIVEEENYSKLAKEFGGVLFSDIRDWDDYDEKFRDFQMNAEPTYKGLIHSITNPMIRFSPRKDVTKNIPYISKITIMEKDRLKKSEILLSRSYNCIIGKSGSGKSLLLYLINKRLVESFSEEKYSFADNNEIFFYDNNGDEIKKGDIIVSVGKNFYDEILKSHKSTDTNEIYNIVNILDKNFIAKEDFNNFKIEYKKTIDEYYKFVSDFSKTETSLRESQLKFNNHIIELEELNNVKIFDLEERKNLNLTYKEEDVEEFKKYDKSVEKLLEILDSYIPENDLKEETYTLIEKLKNNFLKMLEQIQSKVIKEKYENKKIDIINKSIRLINKNTSLQAQRKSELKSFVSNKLSTLSNKYVNNFLLKKTIENYDLSIKTDWMKSEKQLDSQYEILIKELFGLKEITELNIRENNVFYTHMNKGKLSNDIYNMTKKEEAKIVINKYIETEVIKESKDWWNKTFDIKAEVFLNGTNVNEMNPGDIAKTYIKIYFENEVKKGGNNIVIFDQIENDVDKEFINSVIIDLLEETKGHIQLLIVTHDPIVAVNADPTNYILAEKDEDGIGYKSFVPESELEDSFKIVASVVDGSIDAIKKRYKIYEIDDRKNKLKNKYNKLKEEEHEN